MIENPELLASQLIVQIGLFFAALIAIAGGTLQMYLGQPDTSARLDNVHRFMAGVYFSTGLINLWAAITIQQQGFLVYLLAFGIFFAGIGRLISIKKGGCKSLTQICYLFYTLQNFSRTVKFQTTSWSII